jgi:type I restriction enzyme S subunit
MEKLKNIPSLRFPEFKGDWEVRKLKEVADIGRGKSKHRPRDAEFLYGGNYPFIQTGDIRKAGLYLTEYSQTYSEEGLKQSKLWFEDTLCITIAANIAETSILKIKACFPDSIIGLMPSENKTTVLFVKHLFDKFKIQIQSLSQGAAQDNLNQEKLSNIEFVFPELIEQTKIASFLTTVDDKLQSLKQKKTLLEQYKKGVMQKIFSQEIRFKDDSGNDYPDWEETKVKDIFVVTRGNVLSMSLVTNEQDENNLFPVYSSQTKNNGLSGYYDKFLFEDCITWTTDGAGAGDVNFRKGKFYCTNVCGVLKSDKGYANTFVAEILNSVSRKYVSYVGNPKLMNNVMSEIQISIPTSIEEQTKIANFLSAIDNKINHCETQIEKMEVWKKGLLQQMFV